MVSNDECSCSQKGSNDDTRDRSSASLVFRVCGKGVLYDSTKCRSWERRERKACTQDFGKGSKI